MPTPVTRLLLIVMFSLVIAGLPGWWASVWTPPTTIPLPASSVNALPVMVILLAPSPVWVKLASASLPMPRPTCPRFMKVSPLKVMLLAAETSTAAGIWPQCSRVASKSWQPLKQVPKAGCGQLPVMNVPLCWSA